MIANQTWTAENSPYVLTSDVYVSGNLNILEGVEVRAQGNYVFEAAGRVRVLGTADRPVHFRPADPEVGWQGVLFRDAVPGSFFVHSIIEGSRNSGVRITNTAPAFTNCMILNNTSPGNGGGILASVSGLPLVLNGCIVSNNVAGPPGTGDIRGGGVFVKGSSVLYRCDIIGNKTQGSQGVGGGIYTDGDCEIYNSRIISNLAGGTSRHYGSGMQHTTGRLRMRNCLISANGINNAAGDSGGLRFVGSDGELVNCVFVGNANRGIGQHTGSLRLLNCTLVSSELTGLSWFGGSVAITNSIIYFNSGGGHQIDVHNNIRVSYSNVQGGYSGAGNLSLSPALCPDTFALLAGSPCIDAGHPGLEYRDSVISSDDCSPYARGRARNDMGAFGGPGVVGWTEPYAEPVIRIAPVNRMGFEGQPVALDVLATGMDPLAYQWLHQGQGLTGETNAVLSISSAALEHAGDYTVEVRNALGFVVSVRVRLGIAKLETRTDGLDRGRPRLLIRNGQAGQQCAIYSTALLPSGEHLSLPGSGPGAWELRATLTFPADELSWIDPVELDPGESRYYGVVPVP